METENFNNDSKKLEDKLDFSNLDGNHELFSNKNKKVISKFKIENPKNIWIDECISLTSKVYLCNCKGNIESKNKIKGISISQSKHKKFEEYKKCLDGEEYLRQSNNYIVRSINREMHLQEVKKTTSTFFVDKRNYLDNIKSLPLNYSYLRL